MNVRSKGQEEIVNGEDMENVGVKNMEKTYRILETAFLELRQGSKQVRDYEQ